jgi:3-hydroxyisobutyrate dehydrogenase-like beta-hydroxyacid dehydrogenase
MSDHHQSIRNVSVIGLGSMGSGIARTFLDGGCRVSVWNRSREKVDALVSSGAIACDGPGDALDASTHVVVCLSDYSAWRKVIEDHDLTGRLNGTCIIQLTTGTIDDVQGHASVVEAHGGRVAEGAVMCYPSNLGTDESSLLMSGAPDVLDECDPFLSVLDSNWTSLGEDINRPAILSRALIAGMVTSLVGLVNGAAICRAGGVPLEIFRQLNDRSAAMIQAEKSRLVEAIREGLTEDTEATITSWGGGHQAVLSVASTLETNLVLQDAVQAVFQEGQRMGVGEHDLSALVKVFDPASG